MARKKGKKTTPPHLDKYFQRNVIKESQYKKFWPAYWKAKTESERQSVINRYTGHQGERKPIPPVAAPVETKIRKSVTSVNRDIKRLEKQTGEQYHVVRRDRFGRFNSRGRSYQAVRTVKKGK